MSISSYNCDFKSLRYSTKLLLYLDVSLQPFYGGKLHRITAEVKNAAGTTLTRVQGEWDSALEFTHADGSQEVRQMWTYLSVMKHLLLLSEVDFFFY